MKERPDLDISPLISPFYSKGGGTSDDKFAPGVFYAPVLFHEQNLFILTEEEIDPSRGIFDFSIGHYDASVRTSSFPITEIKLREDENLYVVRGKRRPVVVIAESDIPRGLAIIIGLKKNKVCLLLVCCCLLLMPYF